MRSASCPASGVPQQRPYRLPNSFRRHFLQTKKTSSVNSDESTTGDDADEAELEHRIDRIALDTVSNRDRFMDSVPARLQLDSEPSNSCLRDMLVQFLCAGGDDRLLLDAAGTNKYNTPALPLPAGIHRSSCTSNCSTHYAFKEGEKKLHLVLQDAQNSFSSRLYDDLVEQIRSRLRQVWGVPADASVTLCPSGTDAEYLPLLVALGRVLGSPKSDWGSGILSIVTGAGEVGSGTAHAARGQIFSAVAPKPGLKCRSGDPVFVLPAGFPPIELVEVSLRNTSTGLLKAQAELDSEVRGIVEAALNEQGFCVAVVHLVAGSKTGHLVPGPGLLTDLAQKFGKAIVPVVDACQGRLQDGALRDLLAAGFVVLTTGSKFYGGPPFSGAVLTPASVTQEIEGHLPATQKLLGHLPVFMDESLLADDCVKLRQFVSETFRGRARNWGLVFRWLIALTEIEQYHRVPEGRREQILHAWVRAVQGAVAELDTPLLQLQQTEETEQGKQGRFGSDASQEAQAGMLGCNTILSLICRVPTEAKGGGYKRLGPDDLKRVHKLMATDLRKYQSPHVIAPARAVLPVDAEGPHGLSHASDVGDVLALRCFIAQPVQLQQGSARTALAVLRVAISAPLVYFIYEKAQRLPIRESDGLEKTVQKLVQNDKLLLLKLALILQNWQLFQK